MAVVKPGDLPRFLREGWKSCRIALVHGSDEGLVRETADQIVALAASQNADPMNLIRLDGEAIAQDPPRLADELNTYSMFGGVRVVHVRGAARIPASVAEAVFSEPPGNAWLVLEAGELKAGAGLRALAEKAAGVATIACYQDNAQAIQRLIGEVLQAHGLTIQPDARDLLTAALGNDRALSRGELEKLALYVLGQKTIDAAMVLDVIADAGRHEVSSLIDIAFAGDISRIETEANRLFAAGINPAAILSQGISHVLLLRRVLRAGGGEPAIRQSRLHFSRIAAVQHAARLWSESRLDRALKQLADAVLHSRKSAGLAGIITIRVFWSVSRMAQSEAR